MIKSIRIKNYKTCKDVKINLKEPLMALIGKNAAGKTNTLMGLYHACRDCLQNSDDRDKFKLNEGFSAEFELDVKHDRGIKSFIYKYKVYGKKRLYMKDTLWLKEKKKKKIIFKKTSETELTIYHEDKKEEKIPIPAEYSGLRYLSHAKTQKESSANLFENLSRSLNLMIWENFYQVKYYSNQQQSNIIYTFFSRYIKWIEEEECENKDELFTLKYYNFYHSRHEDFLEYEKILIALNLVENIFIHEVNTSPEDSDSDTLIYIAFGINGKEVRFSDLSDGTKRMIKLLFYFLYEKNTLMLIEEPENSIHWGLLTHFLAVLDQYIDNRKVVFSTHSEHVLNRLEPEQLIYVDNIGGATKVKTLSGKSLKSAKRYLSDVGPLGEYFTSGGLEGDIDD